MTVINTKEFGNVGILSQEEKCPVGIVLREIHEGVILEEYFDAKGIDVEVLHIFEIGISLGNKNDFNFCLEEARLYEPNLEIPIYVSATKVSIPEEDERLKKNKVDCISCMVEWNLRHAWSLSPPIEKCEKCQKEKAEKNNQ